VKNNLSYEEIAKTIKSQKKWLIVSHVRPDADAYGSSCGLKLILDKLNIVSSVVNETENKDRYQVIPYADRVLNSISDESWDGVIVCDCGDRKRVGDLFLPIIEKLPLLINIDHHVSNNLFGTHNLVIPTASSTSEIIFDLSKALGVQLDGDMSTALFAGIAGDTGSFKYQSTTADTFTIGAELVKNGASPYKIHQALYGSQSLAATKLQSEALSQMNVFLNGQIAEVVVNLDLIKKYKADIEDADVLVDMARDIENIRVAVLLRQDDEIWRVSLRSKNDSDNVSKIAEKFGGGGHKAAAGFRWRGNLKDLQNSLRREIESAIG